MRVDFVVILYGLPRLSIKDVVTTRAQHALNVQAHQSYQRCLQKHQNHQKSALTVHQLDVTVSLPRRHVPAWLMVTIKPVNYVPFITHVPAESTGQSDLVQIQTKEAFVENLSGNK